jgi:hypothetical protein
MVKGWFVHPRILLGWCFFVLLQEKQKHMTQKEAILKALEMLGGRAQLKDIYPLAIEIGDFSRSQNMKATIRNCLLTNPKDFRHSDGKPSGWWELTSFQEEIAEMKAEIKNLKEENERLRAVPTEDDFVNKLVTDAENRYKYEKDMIKAIRTILYNLGRTEDAAKLDAWIDGREYKPSMNFEGDYVVNKHIDHEVNGVAKGATGIITNK